MKSLTDELQIAYQQGLDKGKGLRISADPLPPPDRDTPQHPDKNAPPSSPWLPGKSPAPSRDDRLLAHGKHNEGWTTKDGQWCSPSGTHPSNDPSHSPVDDYGNPIDPKTLPGYEDSLQISGNPFGYSDEYINRSKTLYDIINDRGTDPSTLKNAQKQWIKLQKMGDIWKRAERSPLDELLGPAQEKYGPGLKGMPKKEKKDLLIKGTKLPKA